MEMEDKEDWRGGALVKEYEEEKRRKKVKKKNIYKYKIGAAVRTQENQLELGQWGGDEKHNEENIY